MGNIVTTTRDDAIWPPSNTKIDRDPDTRLIWTVVRTGSTTVAFYRSNDTTGTNWTLQDTLTLSGLEEVGPLWIDGIGYLHWCFRSQLSGEDRVQYRRLKISDLSWTNSPVVTGDNGGTPGSKYQGLSILPYSVGSGWKTTHVLVAIGINVSGTVGAGLACFTGPSGGAISRNDSLVTGRRTWLTTATTGRVTPSMDLQHTVNTKQGDGGHVWMAFGRTRLEVVKLAWNGNGWTGPSTATVLVNPKTAWDYVSARYTGNEFAIATYAGTVVRVLERNKANTVTTNRYTPTHPAGTIRSMALNYNSANRDLRIYAVGTSNPDLYFVDYDRALGTWSSWTTVSTSDIIAKSGSHGPDNYAFGRGTYFGNKHDIVAQTEAGASDQVQTFHQSVSFAPTVTWSKFFTTGEAQNGMPADVGASLLLDWTYTDLDTDDFQSGFTLRRQIGAGALNWWNQNTSTWTTTTDLVNTGYSNSQVTIPSGWAANSDTSCTFWVKVYDQSSTPSAYSTALTVIPSAAVNPTVTAPTSSQILTGGTLLVTWTVSEQIAYRVRLADITGAIVWIHDSGWRNKTDTEYLLPTLSDNKNYRVEVTTKNLEGLASTAVTKDFSVNFTESPAPRVILTPLPASGVMQVALALDSPIGTQPAVDKLELYRRPRVYANAIVNSTFEVDASDWTSYSAASMVRSTAQARTGVGSLLLTPGDPATLDWGIATPLSPGTDTDAYTRGFRVILLEMTWASAETSNNVFDNSYLSSINAQAATYRSEGYQVVLNFGLHHAPSWFFSTASNSRFIRNDGVSSSTLSTNDMPNFVFNTAARDLYGQRFVNKVIASLGTDFYAIRIGGGHFGELNYPDASGWWAFDVNALAQMTAAGLDSTWRPGNASTGHQKARDFWAFYISKLSDYLNWQITSLRTAGYNGTVATLQASDGTRSDPAAPGYSSGLDPETAIVTDLNGSTGIENNEMREGYDHKKMITSIPSTAGAVAVWATAMQRDTAVPEVAYWANQKGFRKMGENANDGSYEEAAKSQRQALVYNFEHVLWIRGEQAYGSTGATESASSMTAGIDALEKIIDAGSSPVHVIDDFRTFLTTSPWNGWRTNQWTTSGTAQTIETRTAGGIMTWTDTVNAVARAIAKGGWDNNASTAMANLADCELLARFQFSDNTALARLELHLRGSGNFGSQAVPSNSYWLEIANNSATVTLKKCVGDVVSNITTYTMGSGVTSAMQWVRFQVQGDTIRVRHWTGSEPGAWDYNTSGVATEVASGVHQIRFTRASTNVGVKTLTFDLIRVTSLAATSGSSGTVRAEPLTPKLLTDPSKRTAYVSGWIRPTTADKNCRILIQINGLAGYIATRGTRLYAPVAGSWIFMETWADLSDIPEAVSFWPSLGLEAGATGAFYVDDVWSSLYNTDAGELISSTLDAYDETLVITDSFTRTVTDAWSVPWTHALASGSGTADFDVNGSKGTQSHGSTNNLHYSIANLGGTNGEAYAEITIPVLPTGSNFTIWLIGRMADVDNYYYAQALVETAGTVDLQLNSRVGGTLQASIASANNVVTIAAGNTIAVRFRFHGALLYAKLWKTSSSEPVAWTITGSNNTITSGTQVALGSRLETGVTNTLPVVFSFDNYTASTIAPVVVNDWTIPARTDMEYRIKAIGSNDTTVYGPWTG